MSIAVVPEGGCEARFHENDERSIRRMEDRCAGAGSPLERGRLSYFVGWPKCCATCESTESKCLSDRPSPGYQEVHLAPSAENLGRNNGRNRNPLTFMGFKVNMERTILVIVGILANPSIVTDNKETADRTLKNVIRNRGRVSQLPP